MRFATREEVELLRRHYIPGSRIVLDEMDDPYTKIPAGTQAVVTGVDDAGNILCHWDTGSSLSVAFGADRAHLVRSEEEIRVSLNWLGKRQEKATGGSCPRCGGPLASFKGHVISRRAMITVCDECGMDEAFEDAGLLPKMELERWHCVGIWEP
ncbi:MAG: DUF4314 domain-containing protein [Oscillospiraceae bacterium]|nr:DUF4314 domain-containing protein [Parasporobacterium sp.]MBQ9685407.1 DUF4314 domain-containing protein [Oscillospiraceae bacterium]